MKRLLPILFLTLGLASARAQFGSFAAMPVEINADQTTFESGLAVAKNNVVIHHGETVVYCDYAQYNPDTHDVLVLGNVRIYRNGQLFTGDRAVYNLETKKLTAADFKADVFPEKVYADTLTSLGPPGAYKVTDGIFTTSDTSKPDYYIRAKGARIYEGDRIILTGVSVYVGRTPIMWYPYVYQSLNKNEGFTVIPGYTSEFGAYLRGKFTFPITQDIGATFQMDLMSKRGVGLGLRSSWGGGDSKDQNEWGRFKSYFVHDSNSSINNTSLSREAVPTQRYRISLQDRTYLSEDIYSSVNINKLSDARFLQDFVPGEFRTDPSPDNMVSLAKWNEDYTITLTGRKGLNRFDDFTERLPELAFDGKVRPLFGDSGLNYFADASVGEYRRSFATGSQFPNYRSFRADTFLQIEYPQTLFGWLSIKPSAGIRESYYSTTGQFFDVTTTSTETLSDGSTLPVSTTVPELFKGGSAFRTVFNAGLESSFKVTKTWEQAQSRSLGLDGLRNVIQPYLNLSYVNTSKNPSDILQFDRINPSTQRSPISFPEFNSIDAIENWAILRLGVNNRFQTRRDNQTINWLEINTYFDVNFQRPAFENLFLSRQNTTASASGKTPLRGVVADPGTFSNVYNRISWQPYNWVKLNIDAQNPILDKGFTEINSGLTFMLNEDTQFQISHEYIQGNPLFTDSSYLIIGGYRRINDNWGISAREAYEFYSGLLEQQRYAIHRDLSSWVASLAVDVINDGAGKVTYGVSLTFTLKDMPQIALPVSFDPSALVGGSSKNSGE